MYQNNPYLQDPKQLQHFRQHLSALINYSSDNKQIYTPPAEQQVPLPGMFKTLTQRCNKLKQLLNLNQEFLLQLLPQQQPSPLPSTFNNKSKVKSTIKQFYRQWCQESQQRLKYQEILQLFQKYKQKGKVVIPGCGLGRIVLQFVKAGYATQGNEVSYFMLFGSEFILNNIQQKNQFQIAPFIHTLSGYKSINDALRTVRIPDVDASDVVSQTSEFSMRAGEFVESYKQEIGVWDGVVTCFFIDTATNIFQYIDTIFEILKEDGVWVNYGPLLYHFADNMEEQSVELTWQTLRKYVEEKFEIREEALDETTYCHDVRSSNKVVYKCVKFAATKKRKQQFV